MRPMKLDPYKEQKSTSLNLSLQIRLKSPYFMAILNHWRTPLIYNHDVAFSIFSH